MSQEGPAKGFLGPLRRAALIAVLVGAVGSVGLVVRAGQHSPPILRVLFVLWVPSPFIAVLLADMVSKRAPVFARATLYGLMLVLTLGSLAVYIDDALRPRKAQAAFVFVVVPLVSWVLVAIVGVAALISGRLSGRGDGA